MSSLSTEQAKPEVSTQPRKVPQIGVKSASVHQSGFGYKTVIITAPEGLVVTDLNDHPECWKLLQQDRGGKALAEWDEVEVRFKDAMVTARVNHADEQKVVLFDIKRASKPQRDVALYRDENYEVRWAPEGGFCYWRILDDCRMHSGTWPTAESAKFEMIRREYSVRM